MGSDKNPTPAIPTTYGLCPKCGSVGVSRERRPNGNDRCVNGHEYPSADAVTHPFGPTPASVVETHRPEVPSHHARMEKLRWMASEFDRQCFNPNKQQLQGATDALFGTLMAMEQRIHAVESRIPGEPPCSDESGSGSTESSKPSTSSASSESPSSCSTGSSPVKPPAQACDGSGRTVSDGKYIRANVPCPGCDRCRLDVVLSEKIRELCRLAVKAQNYFVEKPGDLSTLAREVLAMMENPCPTK